MFGIWFGKRYLDIDVPHFSITHVIFLIYFKDSGGRYLKNLCKNIKTSFSLKPSFRDFKTMFKAWKNDRNYCAYTTISYERECWHLTSIINFGSFKLPVLKKLSFTKESYCFSCWQRYKWNENVTLISRL